MNRSRGMAYETSRRFSGTPPLNYDGGSEITVTELYSVVKGTGGVSG